MSLHVPKVNKRALAVFLLAGLAMLAVGVALVLSAARARLSASYGQHLAQVAEQASSAVDTYVYRSLIDVLELGRTPTLRDAVAAANRRPFNRSDVDRLDAIWRSPAPLPDDAVALLDSPASRFLADAFRLDRIYAELLVTDRYGRLVAASDRVSDYDQGDEDWWRTTFGDGLTGRPVLTSVIWDDSAQRYAIEIAVPVPEPGSDRLGGILKVVADSREMLSIVGGIRLGATGEAQLLVDDGTIVFSRTLVPPGTRFYAADAVRAFGQQLQASGPDRTTFVRSAAPDGEPYVIGLAPSHLVLTFPQLPWIVAVMQSEAELLAPVRALGWYLLGVFGLTALAVLIFALWFSIRLAQPPVTSDLHLMHHAPVMHVGTTEDPILPEDGEPQASRP